MAYIDEIIEYMEQNIANISIKKVDELRKPFNISPSKFRRNFKGRTESTPRYYLIRMKIELAHYYKSKDPALTIKEVVLKIGWDLTERQFADLFKTHYGMTFGGKAINSTDTVNWWEQSGNDSLDNDFMFSQDRKDLEEIIFRMVLLTGIYSVRDDGELCKTVIYEMQNTCFRLPMFAFEKEVIFRVFFDRTNYERLDLFAIFSRTGETDYSFVPTDKSAYLSLIYNVAIKQEKNVKDEILDSILNWNEMIEGENGFMFLDYQQHIYNKNIRPQINRNAGIFVRSQPIYDSFTNQLREEYENLLNSMNVSETELSKFIHAVDEEDRLMIKSTLDVLCGMGGALRPQKLDLLLRLAECPYMEFIEFEDYSFNFDKTLIEKTIELIPRDNISQLITEYSFVYRDKIDYVTDDDDNYYGNEILSGIVEGFLLK
ncbi:helix-turn-helix domain-containing protein [Chryseobacterium sp. IT-36CA2]|uniref:helix-turn-helix domain-containing protein n=1 Tax=Chryseobacterium sp. IT-36CA2 TaxID=3026460 RepID=UPI0039E06904